MKAVLISTTGILTIMGMLTVGSLTGSAVAQVQSSSSSSSDENGSPPMLMDALRDHEQYTVLVAALKRTGIDQGLRISPSYTLLAPTDSAFAALDVSVGTMETQEVAELLRNHVIQKALTIRQLKRFSNIENARGLSMGVSRDVTSIGGAELVQPDLTVENGVVHGIGSVLTMKTIAQANASSE